MDNDGVKSQKDKADTQTMAQEQKTHMEQKPNTTKEDERFVFEPALLSVLLQNASETLWQYTSVIYRHPPHISHTSYILDGASKLHRR